MADLDMRHVREFSEEFLAAFADRVKTEERSRIRRKLTEAIPMAPGVVMATEDIQALIERVCAE